MVITTPLTISNEYNNFSSEWPAKTQETEFGVIRSRGKRRTASSWSRPKKRQKLLQGAKLG